MYWLDNNTGIPTAPTIPPVISAAKRYFTNGGAGVQPSVPEDFWFNMVTEELLGVLDMAGIAPDKDDLGQLAKAIQSIAFSAYPVGAPIPWPTAVPPAGCLVLNGQSFNPSTYTKLALAYPSGVLPDLRGEFIRGFDNGRGIDPGRAILSAQLDAFQNFTGTIGSRPLAGTNGAIAVSAGAFSTQSQVGASGSSPIATGAGTFNLDVTTLNPASVARTAAETRPRNISFYYIVRAA